MNDCNEENIPNEFAAEDNIVTSESTEENTVVSEFIEVSTEENNTDTGTSESLMDEVEESAISDNNIFQQYSKDYIEGLHRDDVRSIVIILYYVPTSKLNFPLTEAAGVISDIIGKSDRTIREWHTSFMANNGSFTDTLRGKYQRSGVLWQNEELNKKATKFVRENAFAKARPNMTSKLYEVHQSVSSS